MLQRRYLGCRKIDDAHLLRMEIGFHVFTPQLADGLIGLEPGVPVRLFPKRGGRLAQRPFERSRERLRPLVSTIEGNVEHLTIRPKGQLVHGALHASHLNVPECTDAEPMSKKAVKVILREARDLTELIEAQLISQMV